MAQLLDGKIMAAELEAELKQRVEALAEKGCTPGLTVILVGEDPASQTYVSNKEKACARLGIRSETLRMPDSTTQEELEKQIIRPFTAFWCSCLCRAIWTGIVRFR